MTDNAKPFYKCAGGKSSLVETILSHAPDLDDFDTYVEPFFGGGAVFFALYASGRLERKRVVLADADAALVDILRAARRDPEGLHAQLSDIKRRYDSASPDERESMYLDSRLAWNTGMRTPVLTFFLRGTAFNGLWRISKQGRLNTPWGKYATFNIPKLPALHAVQAALKTAVLATGDFRQVFSRLGEQTYRSFTYVDPPYDGGFVSYTENGFTAQDQVDLITQCCTLTAAGGHVIYSNANTDAVNGMLREHWPNAVVHHVLGRRSVAASGTARGDAREILAIGGPQL